MCSGRCCCSSALLVKLDSPGPALFTQQRITKGGSKFTIYKFRTMTAGAAAPLSRNDAMTRDHDPRITRLGAFLRKSRIDELPQILNILKGEMSWIGPRPEAAPLAEWYESQLPFYQYRHIVPPGITGWAQVNQGHVTDPDDVLDKLHYDFLLHQEFFDLARHADRPEDVADDADRIWRALDVTASRDTNDAIAYHESLAAGWTGRYAAGGFRRRAAFFRDEVLPRLAPARRMARRRLRQRRIQPHAGAGAGRAVSASMVRRR